MRRWLDLHADHDVYGGDALWRGLYLGAEQGLFTDYQEVSWVSLLVIGVEFRGLRLSRLL